MEWLKWIYHSEDSVQKSNNTAKYTADDALRASLSVIPWEPSCASRFSAPDAPHHDTVDSICRGKILKHRQIRSLRQRRLALLGYRCRSSLLLHFVWLTARDIKQTRLKKNGIIKISRHPVAWGKSCHLLSIHPNSSEATAPNNNPYAADDGSGCFVPPPMKPLKQAGEDPRAISAR